MLINLFKSWTILAPNEVTLWDNKEAITLQKNQPPCHTWVKVDPWLDEQDALQGYLQRCIKARGWIFALYQLLEFSKACVTDNQVCQHECEGTPETPCKALQAAYLKALAAQRLIAPNTTWKHFKGGDCTVMGQASHESVSGLTTDDWLQSDSAQRLYRCEENPEIKLWLNYYRIGKFDYSLSEGSQVADHGDRVFYINDGIGYARRVNNFLGLVGAEHPKHEGLLRFAEVK